MTQRRTAFAVALVPSLVAMRSRIALVAAVALHGRRISRACCRDRRDPCPRLPLPSKRSRRSPRGSGALVRPRPRRAQPRCSSGGFRRRALGLAEISAAMAAMTMPLLASRFSPSPPSPRRGRGRLAFLARTLMAAMTLVARTAIFAAAAGPPDFDELRLCGRLGSCRRFRCRFPMLPRSRSLGRRFSCGSCSAFRRRFSGSLFGRGFGHRLRLRLDDDRCFFAGRERRHLGQQGGRRRGIAGHRLIDNLAVGPADASTSSLGVSATTSAGATPAPSIGGVSAATVSTTTGFGGNGGRFSMR